MSIITELRDSFGATVAVSHETETDGDGWQMLAITLTPVGGKKFVFRVPVARKLEGFRRAFHPAPRAIKTESGTIRLVHDELDLDNNRVTYEDAVRNIFRKHMRGMKYSARRVSRDTWVGAHQCALELKEMLNALPVQTDSCIGRDYTIGNRVYTHIEGFEDIQPAEREAALLEVAYRHFGGLFPTSVSDNMRVDACGSRVDLRDYAPFAKYNHHPKRPLSQSLQGMEIMDQKERPEVGYPWLISTADWKEFKGTFYGRGLNLVTAFITCPDTYEDQIVMSSKWKDIITLRTHKYTVIGGNVRSIGTTLSPGNIIGTNADRTHVRYEHEYPDAMITDITDTHVLFNGMELDAKTVTVRSYTYGINGRKVTNRHGGKGVVKFSDKMPKVLMPDGTTLGIDVIVDADSPRRRGNTGQIIEALYNFSISPYENSQIRVTQEYWSKERIIKLLKLHSMPENGAFPIIYPDGSTITTVCGRIFWSIIEDPYTIGSAEERQYEEG